MRIYLYINEAVRGMIMENEEILKKLADNSDRSLKLQKLRTTLVLLILAMILLSVFMVVPKVVKTLREVEKAAITVEETASKAQTTIDEIDKMANSLTTTGDGINSLLSDNSEKLTESLDKMSQIDFDGLNQGIRDLQDAIGPFANLMNSFKR